jgi:hypothetical protein
VDSVLFPSAVWRRLWRDAAIVVAVAICVARATGLAWTHASDFAAYYGADLSNLYAGSAPGGPGAFLYSPIFAFLTEPLRWLPFNVALATWTALELGCLIAIAGPWSLLLLFPLAPEWMDGNVHLVMAAAVYLGVRRAAPWTWAVPAFTKLAPALGLAWFAFRREWRALAGALGAIALLAGVSFALAPELWRGWATMLVANAGSNATFPGMIGVPLVARLPIALALVAWGARTDRRWTVPLACGLAMPLLWISATFTFALAAARLAEPNLGALHAWRGRLRPIAEPAGPATVPAFAAVPAGSLPAAAVTKP